MKWRAAFLLLLLVAGLAAPLWLRDPTGRPIMTLDDWLETPRWLDDAAATVERTLETALPAADSRGAVREDITRPDRPAGGGYYRWQDDAGVWHFADEAPSHLAGQLVSEPLPEPVNRIGAPVPPGAGGGRRDSGGMGPVFDSSMSGPLPAGVSREAIETLLQEAHERRMGGER